MGSRFKVEVTVRGGFPIVVRGEVCPPESENGIRSSYLDYLDYSTLKGGSVDWLKLTREEEEEIEEKVWDKVYSQMCSEEY